MNGLEVVQYLKTNILPAYKRMLKKIQTVKDTVTQFRQILNDCDSLQGGDFPRVQISIDTFPTTMLEAGRNVSVVVDGILQGLKVVEQKVLKSLKGNAKAITAAVAGIEVLTGGMQRSVEIPLKSKMITMTLRGTAGVSFDAAAMSADASILLGLDFKTKAAQGPLLELEVAPHVDLKEMKVDNLGPTVSILGGPKLPVLSGNVAESLVALAKSTMKRFMAEAAQSGPGPALAMGRQLIEIIAQPEVLGSILPSKASVMNSSGVQTALAVRADLWATMRYIRHTVEKFHAVLLRLEPFVTRLVNKLPKDTAAELHKVAADIKRVLSADNVVTVLLKEMLPTLLRNLPGQAQDLGSSLMDDMLDTPGPVDPVKALDDYFKLFRGVFERINLLECFQFLKETQNLPAQCLWIPTVEAGNRKDVDLMLQADDMKEAQKVFALALEAGHAAVAVLPPVKQVVQSGQDLVKTLIRY
jgi:hypothetical protein